MAQSKRNTSRAGATSAQSEWLQLMLDNIISAIDEVKTSTSEIWKTVAEVRETLVSITQEVRSIHTEQGRMDASIRQQENRITDIDSKIGEIEKRLAKNEALDRTINELREENAKQSASIKDLQEWKIRKESSWVGTNLIIAGLSSIIPIIAAVYGVITFLNAGFG